MCDIFEPEIISKHFTQLRIRKEKVVLSHQINNGPNVNEVSFCFSKTFVIYRCLHSKSSFFDKREMTYYTLQRQGINKHVLDLALTLIYGFYRGVGTLIVFVLQK